MSSRRTPEGQKNISGSAKKRGRPRKTTASAESSEPPTHETSQPAQSNRSTRAPRTYLTDNDKLVLARLCVQYQSDHKPGEKTRFWKKIGLLLKESTGKELKDPQDAMTTMLLQFEIDEARELRESGTVQNDSDIKQALRNWREHEQCLEQEKEDAKKPQEVLDKEAEEAAIHRRNLLLGLKNKC